MQAVMGERACIQPQDDLCNCAPGTQVQNQSTTTCKWCNSARPAQRNYLVNQHNFSKCICSMCFHPVSIQLKDT